MKLYEDQRSLTTQYNSVKKTKNKSKMLSSDIMLKMTGT